MTEKPQDEYPASRPGDEGPLATVRRLVDEVHNGHHVDRLGRFHAPGYAEHDPRIDGDPELFWRELVNRLPDLSVSIDLTLEVGDQVMTFLTWRGHEENRELRLCTSEVFQVDAGLITAHGAVVDYAELAEFGITPRRSRFPSFPEVRHRPGAGERENIKTVLGAYEEVMTKHLLDRADAYYHHDYTHHNAQMPAVPNGVAAFKEFFAGNFARYPDLSVTADHVLARGDEVMVFATWRGTFTGFARGRRPTGRRLEMRTSDKFRLEHGRVAEHWEVVDYAGLQRVGVPIRPPHHDVR